MPFGCDGSGYLSISLIFQMANAASPMPFGCDGSGYLQEEIADILGDRRVSNAFRL